ncbi:MAG: hypothetical protein KBC66_10310 [Kiritimatiellae bacterium]|jgi:hypothetical protein|nr:hypothetical protein [Kiritimatiellia bacterium]NLD89633.1 hypothetical protein [Lentisphaerota bacterium]HPC19159.1 hypothetical protein [Kiritimatiellia bacterium]
MPSGRANLISGSLILCFVVAGMRVILFPAGDILRVGSVAGQKKSKGHRMETFIVHAQEYMFFSLIAQAFTCILLVLVWLQLKKK